MSETSEEIDVLFDEEEWGEEDLDDENHDSLYIKYLFEGVLSLPDLATAFRAFADELVGLVDEGWQMEEPVTGGWAHLRRVLGNT